MTLTDVCRTYVNGDLAVPVLKAVSLQIDQGEFVAIMGPSGSGKSTLLNIMGCLDRFDRGEYRLGEHRMTGREEAGSPANVLPDAVMASIRSQSIGFVFQSFNLIPRMSALRNVALPMIYRGVPPDERRERAAALLGQMGLSDRLTHRPTQLSGGQQQRVAIARALANQPAVLIADEPTGSLDSATSADIMDVFQTLHADGMTVVMVSHEPAVARCAERVIELVDGRVVS